MCTLIQPTPRICEDTHWNQTLACISLKPTDTGQKLAKVGVAPGTRTPALAGRYALPTVTMPLVLSTGYGTAETLVNVWASAIGAHFQDEELGTLLGRALISKGIRSLGNLRERRRDEVISILQEHEGLGPYLVDELQKFAAYSLVEVFSFPASVADDGPTAKKLKVLGGSRANSFNEHRGTFPEGYEARRDTNCLPSIIASELPTAKLLDAAGLSKVTSAAAAFLFLKYGAVHFAHPDEGSVVRDTLLQLSRLIVERGYKVITGTKKAPAVLEAAPAVQRILEAMKSKLVQTKQMVREQASPEEYNSPKKSRVIFSITASEAVSRKELLEAGFEVAYPVRVGLEQDHGLSTSSTVEQFAAAPTEPAQAAKPAPATAGMQEECAGGGAWGDAASSQIRQPALTLGQLDLPKVRAVHRAPTPEATHVPPAAKAAPPTKQKRAPVAGKAAQATAATTATATTATEPASRRRRPADDADMDAASDTVLCGEAFKKSNLNKVGKYTMLTKEEVSKLSRNKEDMMAFKGYGAKNIRVAVLWSGADWYPGFFNHLDKKVVITKAEPKKMWVGWCDGDDPRNYDLEMSEYDGVTPDVSWVLLTTSKPSEIFGVF